jgi:N-acyl-L-homoserine lactone synthetase
MIYVVDPSRRVHFKSQLNRFFLSQYMYEAIRAKNLNLAFQNKFDTDEAVYILYIDDQYPLCAGLRLLPTTGKHLSNTLCSSLSAKNLKRIHLHRSPKVWECSRFFIDLPRAIPDFEQRYDDISQILLNALEDYVSLEKIDYIISFFPTETHQALCRSGWPFKISETFLINNTPFTHSIFNFSSSLEKRDIY